MGLDLEGSCRITIVIAYVFGHNPEGLTVGHVGCKPYDSMRIGIIVDLNLCVIVYILLCGYLLRARTSPLGILLPCTALSGIRAEV